MKNILIVGAGLSSSSLIKYLLDNSTENQWKVYVGDVNKNTAESKINGHPNGVAISFDIFNETQKDAEIAKADVVISMLPAKFHPIVAQSCIKHGKHMITASYVSNEMKQLNDEAKSKGLSFLNELGVDPGIDHMSAMKIVDKIRNEGGKLLAFKSSTGGLIAPEYDNNPWNYKFTWNPRNVVLAGQGVSMYLEKGDVKYIPYHRLFERLEKIEIPGLGDFEIYPNRDSLKYREIYNLNDIPTIFRGTIRRPGYCKAWNIFVQLGLTDDTYTIENSANMTYRQFINMYLPYHNTKSVEEKIIEQFNLDINSDEMNKLKWLGIFENDKIGLEKATPAQILQKKLEEKWVLGKDDKDLIVMQHQFEYSKNNKNYRIISSLNVIGQDTTHTAMSLTVGLPVAIATKMLLTGKIKLTGVHTPVIPELYNPILDELEQYGIVFTETETEI
jgi:saccharopine dehydrogenase-like NADP-dependent oxidoreductase